MRIESPKRVARSYVQRLIAAPAQVFPLLCPVRETEWIEGWDPRVVYSLSGVAEPDCVFQTAAGNGDVLWYVTRHDPTAGEIEMIRISPGVTACRLNILLRPAPGGSEARIRYMHTSIGPEGDAFVEAFTEAHFRKFMRQWETRLNYYLANVRMLRDGKG
jgi:hypothetical protein